MKNVALCFLFFLVCSLPVKVWNDATKKQRLGIILQVANAIAEMTDCRKGFLTVTPKNDTLFFYFDCDEGKQKGFQI